MTLAVENWTRRGSEFAGILFRSPMPSPGKIRTSAQFVPGTFPVGRRASLQGTRQETGFRIDVRADRRQCHCGIRSVSRVVWPAEAFQSPWEGRIVLRSLLFLDPLNLSLRFTLAKLRSPSDRAIDIQVLSDISISRPGRSRGDRTRRLRSANWHTRSARSVAGGPFAVRRAPGICSPIITTRIVVRVPRTSMLAGWEVLNASCSLRPGRIE